MPGLFGMGVPATVSLAVVVLAAVAVAALPGGRAALAALVGSVARLPSLIGAEMRGAAPLRVDGAVDTVYRSEHRTDEAVERRDGRWDTTPDIPPVTRGLPVVKRPNRT